MNHLDRIVRKEKKRQHYEKMKNGQPYQIRCTVRLDYKDRRDLVKKSGMSLQKTIQKLVKEYLKN